MMLVVDAILVLIWYFHNQRYYCTLRTDLFRELFIILRAMITAKNLTNAGAKATLHSSLLLTGYHKNSIVFISTIKWNSNICIFKQTTAHVGNNDSLAAAKLIENENFSFMLFDFVSFDTFFSCSKDPNLMLIKNF